MSDLIQVLRNGVIAILIVAGVLLILASLVAPPKIVFLSVTNTRGTIVDYDGIPLFPAAEGARFLYLGQSNVYIRAPDHEMAEIRFGSDASVFQGNADVSKWLGFLFLADVRLVPEDPNLKFMSYSGVLTVGGNRSPQILPLHPKYRGTHQPYDYVKRQFENATGRDFSSVPYLRLERQGDTLYLDFSQAGGGALEYLPPSGWEPANLYVRVHYSMTSPPHEGYETRLRIHRLQDQTPYQMGTTFFYCRFRGYYCAGTVSTGRSRGDEYETSVEIWHNTVQGDARLRYR